MHGADVIIFIFNSSCLQVTVALLLLLLLTHSRALDPEILEDSAAVLSALEERDENSSPTDIAAPAAPPAAAPLSKAERLLEKASEIRRNPNASEKDLKRSVDFLYASAGIEHLSIEKRSTRKNNTLKASVAAAHVDLDGESGIDFENEEHDESATADFDDIDTDSFITAADVNIQWRNGTIQHPPAVKELIFVFREGDGAPLNPAIGHRLLQELAAHGDSEAQADIAFYLSQGVEPVAPNSRRLLFTLVQPDLPAALVHLHFAAKAGDPIAQMTLGYRFLYVSLLF